MEIKPIADRTNAPLIAAFVVWVLAILMMSFSRPAYFMLTAAAIALFACQVLMNVRVRRA